MPVCSSAANRERSAVSCGSLPPSHARIDNLSKHAIWPVHLPDGDSKTLCCSLCASKTATCTNGMGLMCRITLAQYSLRLVVAHGLDCVFLPHCTKRLALSAWVCFAVRLPASTGHAARCTSGLTSDLTFPPLVLNRPGVLVFDSKCPVCPSGFRGPPGACRSTSVETKASRQTLLLMICLCFVLGPIVVLAPWSTPFLLR